MLYVERKAAFLLSADSETDRRCKDLDSLKRKVHSLYEEARGLEAVLSVKSDLLRLERAFNVAEAAGDANAMLAAQKALYYAKRKVEKWVRP
jgi:hypothetical protein